MFKRSIEIIAEEFNLRLVAYAVVKFNYEDLDFRIFKNNKNGELVVKFPRVISKHCIKECDDNRELIMETIKKKYKKEVGKGAVR